MDITRSARLASYLCLKGIPEQALVVLRGAIEQTGVHAHVWKNPEKHVFVPNSDSDDYATAFRRTKDKKLLAELQANDTRFRFMYCKAGNGMSTMYALLSTYIVHGSRQRMMEEEALSCEFVDCDSPVNVAPQFEMVQSIISLIYFELLNALPKDDLMEEELAPLSIASGLFLPLVAFKTERRDD